MSNKFVMGENVEIQIIKQEQLYDAMLFQKRIIDSMLNKEWFIPLTGDDFLNAINGNGNVYFLLNENEIIGLFVLVCDISNKLEEYKLPNNNYMLIDSIMVKDNYRGYGLQRQMLKFAYERAKELKISCLIATVHPNNIYSLNNYVAEKYELLHTLTIYGVIRNVMIKNII